MACIRLLNLELAPFPYAALLPLHLSSHVSSDSLLLFHIEHLFLFTLVFVLIFIPPTHSAPFPMFACPPTLLSYHTHTRPYNLTPVRHCKSICMASHCNARKCLIMVFYSVVPHLIFLQGKEAVWRVVQRLHLCSPEERFTQVLGEGWGATKGVCVDGAHSVSEGCSC